MFHFEELCREIKIVKKKLEQWGGENSILRLHLKG